MNTFLNQVKNKGTLSFLNWGIKNLKDNGRDVFEISRLCISWSRDTGCPAYEFREALEKHIAA